MKKIIFLLLLVTNYSFGQWTSFSSNQLISEMDIKQAVINSPYLQLKSTLPNGYTSGHLLKKSQLISCFWVDSTVTTLAAKAQNQIISKQDVAAYTFSSFYAHNISPSNAGSAGCPTSLSNLAPVYTSSNATPITGTTVIYTNTGLTIPFNGTGLSFILTYNVAGSPYSYVVIINSSGVVTSVYSCVTWQVL